MPCSHTPVVLNLSGAEILQNFEEIILIRHLTCLDTLTLSGCSSLRTLDCFLALTTVQVLNLSHCYQHGYAYAMIAFCMALWP